MVILYIQCKIEEKHYYRKFFNVFCPFYGYTWRETQPGLKFLFDEFLTGIPIEIKTNIIYYNKIPYSSLRFIILIILTKSENIKFCLNSNTKGLIVFWF